MTRQYVNRQWQETFAREDAMTADQTRAEPLSAEEEAKFRESVRLLGPVDDYGLAGTLHWSNRVAMRLLATLDAARDQREGPPGLDVERLMAAMQAAEFRATGLPMGERELSRARIVVREYERLTDGLIHDPAYANAVWDAATRTPKEAESE